MMNGFYTCVDRKFNNILYRGYDEEGRKIYNKFKFRPQLFLDSKEIDTKWHTLDGTNVEPIRFESMGECRDFQKQYEDLKDFKIYGNEKHINSFIQAEFPDEIKYDSRLLDICYFDLENKISESTGFPPARE